MSRNSASSQSYSIKPTHGSFNEKKFSKNSWPESSQTISGVHDVLLQREYHVLYLGYAVLDRRYTLPMLPWLVAEIKRRSQPEPIAVEVTQKSLKALSAENGQLLFEHPLSQVSKFAQSSRDPSCFSYMTRSSAYHVFQATEENTVLDLFTAMKEISKEMYSHQSQETVVRTASGIALDSVVNSCQQYEVLYLGKIKVCGKRAHPTFIDDTVEKFRIYEIEKNNLQNYSSRKRHGSGASVSSLPHNMEIVTAAENKIQTQIQPCSKEDLSSSSGISVSESISQKSLDTYDNDSCDADPSLQAEHFQSKDMIRSFISPSKSMDIASVSKSSSLEKNANLKCSLMPPSSLITHTQSLDAQGCADTVHDLRSIDSSANIRDRVRSCSGDNPRAKQISLPTYTHRGEIGVFEAVHRPRAYTSPNPSNSRQSNRTMLFLIGDMEICLIGTDKKQMLLSKTFNDISHCSQGVKHLDHFGFVCRELTSSGGDSYSGYIFQCQTEKVVDEIMQTLKLAFSKAHQTYQKCSEKSSVPKALVCDSCPMQWFHKLCTEIDGVTAEETNRTIMKRLGSLSVANKTDIIVKFQKSTFCNVQEQNEILMTLLREFVEQKQLNHSHSLVANSGKDEPIFAKEKGSRLDSFREKAKKSLSNSLETFLKLTNRDDVKDCSVSSNKRKNSVRESVINDLDTRSYREGSCDSGLHSFDQLSPVSSRPRSSTFGSSREIQSSVKKHPVRHKQEESTNKKPIINMLMKVGNQIHESPPISIESKGSWRQAIFHQVQTPSHSQHRSQLQPDLNSEISMENESSSTVKKTKEDYRALWKKAIVEQILLIRMEKENKKLQVNQDAVCHKRMKLDYEEITPCIKSAISEWDNILSCSKQNDVQMDDVKLLDMVKKGVPRYKRGEIWQFLVEHHKKTLKYSKNNFESAIFYEDLLKKLTSHQHSILIDIGRTFPNHPFYCQTLGCGQLSLFNLLKAYSLLDKEVGYCQGLSFVAGILLLHMPEEQAFFTMKYLMFDLGLRRQYKTDMVAFQIQMYQLSRLIHDNYRDLYEHFEKYDIAPTLYAAPWFLTLFASQFPVGFVSRLFDILFLYGMDVIFKVSLILLGNYKDYILSCDGFESTMNFLKTSLPSIDVLQMEIIFTQVFNLDISHQLHAYEVEYHVLMEEMVHSPSNSNLELENVKHANKLIKAQNMELMEQLQIAYSRIHSLEASEASLKSTVHRLEGRVAALEEEKEALEYSLRVMKRRLEKLEVARIQSDISSEEESHPPPFGIVYAIAGSEKEEDEQFKLLIRDYCQGKDLDKGNEIFESNVRSWSPIHNDIAEENVFEDF